MGMVFGVEDYIDSIIFGSFSISATHHILLLHPLKRRLPLTVYLTELLCLYLVWRQAVASQAAFSSSTVDRFAA